MKNRSRFYLQFLLAIPLCAAMFGFSFVPETGTDRVIDLFTYKVFGRISFYDDDVYIHAMQNLIFLVVCNILFSDVIAKHFRTGCVYVFSRIHDRRKWYLSRVAELLCGSLLFTLCYLAGTLLLCSLATTAPLSANEISDLLTVLGFSLLLSATTSLLVNLLSMKWGTTIGIVAVQFLVFGLVFVARSTYVFPGIMRWNPISCLNILEDRHLFKYILASNMVLFLGVFFFGMEWVSKYDIFLFDAELS